MAGGFIAAGVLAEGVVGDGDVGGVCGTAGAGVADALLAGTGAPTLDPPATAAVAGYPGMCGGCSLLQAAHASNASNENDAATKRGLSPEPVFMIWFGRS